MEPIERIASFLAGTCNQQEVKELEAWRKEAPANEEEFCKFKKIWEAAGPVESFCPDVEKAWLKVQSSVFPTYSVAPAQKRQPSVPLYRTPWAIAAAVALFILGSGIFLMLQQNISNAQGAKLATLQTEISEKQELTLADGTKVWLNQNSRISYPEQFGGELREIQLEGEGYFEVAHMPEKPFIIQAGKGKVQVLGTAFNLEVKKQVKVQVASGRVQFSANEKSPASSVVLEAGDAAFLENDKLRKTKQDPNFMAWKTGKFTFEDTPLKEVFTSLEKYYHIKLSATSDILKCRVYVRFQQQPIEEVLKVLALTLQLKHDYTPGSKEVSFYAQKASNGCFTANP